MSGTGTPPADSGVTGSHVRTIAASHHEADEHLRSARQLRMGYAASAARAGRQQPTGAPDIYRGFAPTRRDMRRGGWVLVWI